MFKMSGHIKSVEQMLPVKLQLGVVENLRGYCSSSVPLLENQLVCRDTQNRLWIAPRPVVPILAILENGKNIPFS